jgi:hypothetical protein
MSLPPETGRFWRGLKADRSGRIWLAQADEDALLALSRSGQVLQQWDLPRLLPGFQGPLRAWCPDERGGLYLAEGWPLRLYHLNAAGNILRQWMPAVDAAVLDLAPDPAAGEGSGVLMVFFDAGAQAPRLRLDARGRCFVLAPEGRLFVLRVRDAERP